MAEASAYLVETIPQGLEQLASADTHHTGRVLLRLVDSAREWIDVNAMYWSLLHNPESPDEEGLSAEALAALGGDIGRQLYGALLAAAARGVQTRILQTPGFSLPPVESASLAAAYPERFQIREVDMGAWYGSGIMHQKLWLVDGRHVYLGSANMDWRALAQVKELGIVVEDDPALAADLRRQFELWWRFGALEPSVVETRDAGGGIRRLPCWSPLLPVDERCPNPLEEPPSAVSHNLAHPLPVRWNDQEATAFTTCSPPALCAPDRTRDIDALHYTIEDADEMIGISVMHFAPLGIGRRAATSGDVPEAYSPVWWPVLTNALIEAVCRGVHVRLLASRWPHTPATMLPHLRALQASAAACAAEDSLVCGRLDVRLFTIPGWDETVGPKRRYPGHSRVNHTKYLVSERRLNVGTSNMTWGDFAHNGGISLNTDHPGLVRQAQVIFERDWSSPYALPLSERSGNES